MRQFFLTVAGVFAGLTLFVLAAAGFLATLAASARASVAGDRATGAVPAATVLVVDLRRTLTDQAAPSPFSGLRPPSLVGLVEALARAEADPRVKGVFVRASESGLDPAQAEEIHEAFLSLRAHGKFVLTHAQGFESTSVTSYLAASASDEIWIQPTANFVATGLGTETPFLAGLFQKLGVDPQFEQFYEYKNAVNTYTETGYTDAHRAATLELLESIYGSSIAQAAEARAGRGLTAERLRSLFEGSPYSAEVSVQLGLTDALGQVVEAREAALDRAGEGAELMDVWSYARAAGRPYTSGPVIAVVAGEGNVVTGEATPSSLLGSQQAFYSDTVADAIVEASEDDAVRAIVLRIDSPGGSSVASDQVWHAVERARDNGKKVVASFGSVAASGGYYVAAGADAIVADAATLTGSIGVYGGKIALGGALGKAGVSLAPLSVGGEFGLAYSSAEPFTPAQREALHGMLAEVYEDFTGKVAQGRGLSREQVEAVARGHVWSGADARDRGLVDEIGGYRDAIEKAKELAGIDPGSSVTVKTYPREPGPFEVLEALFGTSVESAHVLAEMRALAARLDLDAAVEASDRLRPDMMLLAPGIEVR